VIELRGVELATWVGAIATLLAVIVALMKDDIVGFWRRPKLQLSLNPFAPDCHKIRIDLINRGTGAVIRSMDSYYLRLWIENKGNVRATDVQVFAAALHRKHADGNYKAEAGFLPMNLKWSHSQLSPAGPEIFADGLSPQMGKHCDLGHIARPENTDHALLELDVEVTPNTMTHILRPGEYKLELKIAASNSKPIKRFIEINLTGKWFDDEEKMFADGLGLKIGKRM
jgi:hypothetical protein